MKPAETRLLDALKRGPVLSDNSQGYAKNVTTLRVQISRLRMSARVAINHVKGVGYCLEPDYIGDANDAIDYAIRCCDTAFLVDWKAGKPDEIYMQWLKERYS